MSTAKFTAPVAKVRHFLQMSDFSAEEYAYLFERTRIIRIASSATSCITRCVTARWRWCSGKLPRTRVSSRLA